MAVSRRFPKPSRIYIFTPFFLFLGAIFFSPAASGTPLRVVCLSPAICETVAALAEKNIVGRVEYANYPETIRGLPSVGGYNRPNLEAILKLKPDLVILASEGNPFDIAVQLKNKHIRTLLLTGGRIQDYLYHIEQIGAALSVGSAAAALRAKLEKDIAQIKHLRQNGKSSDKSCKSVSRAAYLLAATPLLVLTGRSFISEAFSWVGVGNVFADLPGSYLRVRPEALLRLSGDRQIKILFLSMSEEKSEEEKIKADFTKRFQIETVVVSDSRMMQLTPRFFEAMQGFLKNNLSGLLCH